jgi:hypothetical protein
MIPVNYGPIGPQLFFLMHSKTFCEKLVVLLGKIGDSFSIIELSG